MKKIFTILCLLALTLGAQAQITAVEDIQSDKSYTVETQGRGSWTMAADGSALRSTQYSNVSTTATKWGFVPFEGNTYLYNVETKKFILKNGTDAEANATHGTPVEIVKYTSDQMDGWGASFDTFQSSGHYFAAKMGTHDGYPAYINFGGDKQTVVDAWGPGNTGWDANCGADAGNALKIVEAETYDLQEALGILNAYFNPSATVKYVISDANGVVYTSETTPATIGETISTLPAAMQRNFCTYEVTATEIVEGENTVNVTVTYTMPFEVSTSFANATWYYMTIRGNKYVRADENAKDGSGRYLTSNTNGETDEYQWAFFGNPYSNFKIANKGAGEGKFLHCDSAPYMNNTEDNGWQNWCIYENTSKPRVGDGVGFVCQEGSNYYLNDAAGTGNLGYWNSSAATGDGGSSFGFEKVPGLAELLPEAQTLLSTLTAGANEVQIGYPTADALAAFNQAISTAQRELGGTNEAAALAALKAAIAAVKAVENTNYIPRTDVYYTITSARGSMIYDPSHSADVDNIYGNEFLWYTTSLDNTNANHQWGFVEKDGKYYMYNVGKVQFANVTQGGSYQRDNGDRHTWMFSNAPSSVTLDAGEGGWVATPNVRVRAHSEVTNKEYAMSISPDYTGPVIAWDDVNDGGIPMTFALATTTQDEDVTTAILALLEDLQPYRDALQESIDEVNALLESTGEGLHKYTVTNGLEDLNTALQAAQDELAKAEDDQTKASLQEAKTALDAAKNALTLTLNMPKAGMFLTLKSVHNTYLSGTAASNGSMSLTTTTDANTIFYFDGSKLLTFGNGLYANGREVAAVGGEGLAYEFEESTITAGKYVLRFNPDGGVKRYLYAWDTSKNYADQNSSDHTNCTFTLEEVTELPVKMNTVESEGKSFATFSAPVGVTGVGGATIYSITIEGNQAVYTEIEGGQAPANTGLLLIGEASTTEATITLGEVDATVETEMKPQIVCIEAATAKEENKLFLGTKSGKLGFYNLKSDGGKSGGFKAYIENPAAADGEAKGLILVADGDVTAIDTVGVRSQESGEIYNLQGQRVNKAQKGVFIQNGKKVVVK